MYVMYALINIVEEQELKNILIALDQILNI